MSKIALLFLNGEPPKILPHDISHFDIIACTDGAYSNYLANTAIELNYIIGDLDSIAPITIPMSAQVIYTPDQNKTDFEKALLFLIEQGITQCIIYGATGKASDHMLGNLSVALHYYQQIDLLFYDDFCRFFFATKQMVLNDIKDRTISFVPFTPVTGLTLTGVRYPLTTADLILGGLISTRNHSIEDTVTVSFVSGDLLIFIAL